jgi:hypothetical protein
MFGQVHLSTPEEVYKYIRDEVQWGPSINQAAALDLGRSDWLRSFAQRHLCKCEHYRIMVCDDILDIICEDIAAAAGAYASATR